MEHLFDEYEAKAAAATGSSKQAYRSPPASAASTKFSECDRNADDACDSDAEPVNRWTKYYPRVQCPPGPQGQPKPRSPEEYKAFHWRQQQRQDINDAPRPLRPSLPGFGVNRRPAMSVIAQARPLSRLPGFGGFRRGPLVRAVAPPPPPPYQEPALSWEATLATVNAASHGGSNVNGRRKVCGLAKVCRLCRVADCHCPRILTGNQSGQTTCQHRAPSYGFGSSRPDAGHAERSPPTSACRACSAIC